MGWETLEDAEGKAVAAKRPPLGRTGPALDLAAFLRPSSGSSSGHTAAAQSATVEPSGSSDGSRATIRRPSLASQQSIGVAQPQPQPQPPQVKVIRRAPAVSRAASVAARPPSVEAGHAAEGFQPASAPSAIRSAPPQVSVASAADGAAKASAPAAAPSPAAASDAAAGVAAGRERRKVEQVFLPAHPERYHACICTEIFSWAALAVLGEHRAMPERIAAISMK